MDKKKPYQVKESVRWRGENHEAGATIDLIEEEVELLKKFLHLDSEQIHQSEQVAATEIALDLLKIELAGERADREKAEKEAANLTSDLAAVKKQVDELLEENAQAAKDLEEASEKISALETELAALKADPAEKSDQKKGGKK